MLRVYLVLYLDTFGEALHAIFKLVFHLSEIPPSADPLLQIIAISVFISYLFSKIEERDPERRRQTAIEGWDTNSPQKSDAFQRHDRRKKYEPFAHAMKNDPSISPLREREQKIPKEKVMD